jgi:predicted nucleic acid-binding protein
VTAFVLDSSITLSWFFDDEQSEAADQLLDRLATEEAAVPALWYFEIANGLAIGERRQRTTPARITEFVAQLESLAIFPDEESWLRALGPVLNLARMERLSAYDAAYLELAMRLGVPLATKDLALAAAAGRNGVAVLGAN